MGDDALRTTSEGTAAAGPGSVRRQNLVAVLDVLARGDHRSRADISVDTGLTRATVSALVAQLEQIGLVVVGDDPRPMGPGRPARPVWLSDEAIAVVGVELDADHVRIVASGPRGRPTDDIALDLAPSEGEAAETLAAVADAVTQLVARLAEQGRSTAVVTLAVPGLVDPASSRVRIAPNLGWTDVDPVGPLAERLASAARPPLVLVDNEANLTARAEVRWGAGAAVDPLLVVSAGVGVGAGLVVGGAVFRGAHGFGGELGHVVVVPGGARCRCGNRGCLETVVGRHHVADRLGLPQPTPRWAELLLDGATAEGGLGPGAAAVLDEVVEALASALIIAIDLLDPGAIVLAGDLAPLADHVAPQVDARARARTLGARFARHPVLRSTFGRDAVVLGALASGIDRVLTDPLGLDAPPAVLD